MAQKLILISISLFMYYTSISQVETDTNSLAVKGPVNMTVIEFNKRTNANDKIVLINFKADWCVICLKQKPILEELKVLEKDILEVIVIDMADNPLIAAYFEVDGLPVTLLFKNGVMLWEHTGLLQKNEILDAVRTIVASKK